jgi:hypothetical protein
MTPACAGRWAALSLCLLLIAGVAGAQGPGVRALSIADYTAWLERVALAVEPSAAGPADLARVVRDVPVRWRVESAGQSFEIANDWLLTDLRELQSKPEAVARVRLVDRLRALAGEASAFEAPASGQAPSRARLDEILSRRDFRNIHGPTWVDELRQRILMWIVNVLERLFGSSAVPTVSTILVYMLIGLAAVALAMWTYRSLTRAAALETVVPGRMPVSAKEWSIWLAEAQQAAGRGEWRDAVHLSYWCAVSFLESKGAWKPDRARTPREYLRLLPASSGHRSALTALTRNFELVWYGTEAADERRFAEALGHLEHMGCRRG